MIKALIFDFDGLILETEGPILQSWQELYASHGEELTLDTWSVIIGTAEGGIFDPLEELQSRLGRPLDFARLGPPRLQRETDLIALQGPRPGVEAYLRDARRLGLKVGLASSSPCEWVTSHLERLGLLEYFDCIRASDDVRRTKPDPELYHSVLDEFGIAPDEAIVFEDSPNGALAAVRAGIYVVAVPNDLTRSLPLDHASLRLDSLADLPLEALLEKVSSLPHAG
jgi:HAD superfamily hydrolase (TIGR01509 family)